MSNDKNVSRQRHTWTKAERQYIQGIVHNYSLQRWTDQEIVDYLHEEKKIDIARSTITTMRNKVEQDAEKWYVELRDSSSKYISIYKQRLDSLLSYQKKLHDLINNHSKSPEIVLRSISELHRIEMSMHTLMKELPGDIATSIDKSKGNEEEEREGDHMTFDGWLNKTSGPRVSDDSDYTDEENGKYYWGLHKKYNEYVKEWKDRMFGPDPNPSPWTT